jgi:PPOX class probable F420-dependent enzyme
VTVEEAVSFIRENHRAVLATRKRDGGIQLSPVVVGSLSDGCCHISSRETAYKVRNLRRRPEASLCVLPDSFFGKWLLVEGTARVIGMPEALPSLEQLYRQIAGEHPDWEEFRRAMFEERRVIIEVRIERVGPSKAG